MSEMQARPSALSRIIACPGSLRACAQSPEWMDEYSDNTVREEGTACHHFAYLMCRGQSAKLGDVAPNGVAYDADMQSAAEMYMRAIDETRQGAQVFLEVTLPVPGVGSGTPDAYAIVFIAGRWHVFIWDLKYGFRVVESWPNPQLIAYAMAVCEAHGLQFEECEFHFCIVQPRRWHVAGYVRNHIASGREVLRHALQIIAAVQLAKSEAPPLQPGKHCEWCPGRAECKALRADVLETVVAMPEALPFHAAESELLFLRQYQAKLAAYVSGLEIQIEHGLKTGARSTKFEMRRSQGRRVWNDPAKARILAQLLGVNIEKKPDLITPKQAFDAGMPADLVNLYSGREAGKVTLEIADASKWAKVFGK